MVKELLSLLIADIEATIGVCDIHPVCVMQRNSILFVLAGLGARWMHFLHPALKRLLHFVQLQAFRLERSHRIVKLRSHRCEVLNIEIRWIVPLLGSELDRSSSLIRIEIRQFLLEIVDFCVTRRLFLELFHALAHLVFQLRDAGCLSFHAVVVVTIFVV